MRLPTLIKRRTAAGTLALFSVPGLTMFTQSVRVLGSGVPTWWVDRLTVLGVWLELVTSGLGLLAAAALWFQWNRARLAFGSWVVAYTLYSLLESAGFAALARHDAFVRAPLWSVLLMWGFSATITLALAYLLTRAVWRWTERPLA
jgi:hypothetical protein